MGKFKVKEEGNNGTVEVKPDEIIRTYKKRFGRGDKMRIPMGTVSSVEHKRKLGADVVTVTARGAVFTWKVANDDAKQLTAEIMTYTKA